jgi:uncharacterized protein (TIGR00369 family)
MPERPAVDELPRALQARAQSACFACGQENPRGLQIRFQRQDDGAMTATWAPSSAWEGFRGIIHGGVVSTVLDEAMSKAIAATGTEALTAELRVRFRRHVTASSVYFVRGRVVEQNRRLVRTEAVLTGADGTEYAHAWATFLQLAGGRPLAARQREPKDY